MAYIEKEPIIEFIKNGLNNPNKTKAYGYDAIEILTEIEFSPTADVVEVKHGKWEKKTFIIFDSEKVGYHCSECNTTWDVNTNYCPNCGAKMDGGAE